LQATESTITATTITVTTIRGNRSCNRNRNRNTKTDNRQPGRQLPNVLLLLAIGILASDVVCKLHAASSK